MSDPKHWKHVFECKYLWETINDFVINERAIEIITRVPNDSHHDCIGESWMIHNYNLQNSTLLTK